MSALYSISADGKSITRNTCGYTSHHPVDVKERFCSHCIIFHDDYELETRALREQVKGLMRDAVAGANKETLL